VFPTVALPLAADAALEELAALATPAAFSGLRGAELLAERAACYGFARRGRVAPGGACRLLEARRGWLAANLPRDEDARALAAWLEDDALASLAAPLSDEAWRALAACVRARDRDACVERARLLGLAVAPAEPPGEARSEWLRIGERGASAPPRPAESAPLVVDLSSLWAGPLAARLLRLAGARVVKVESTRRPDGARLGNAAFFDRLNAGKESVALDFAARDDADRLRALLERADVVIESARPRALRQLGIDADAWVRARPGRVWLSITGYGRGAPNEDWVAFGDDAAAAAGLCWCVPRGAPLFVGDAIADPLAGLHGALAAQRCWRRGEGALLDVALTAVVAHAIAHADPVSESSPAPAAQPPRLLGAKPPPARELGADTRAVLAELAIP
jgi:hypothetical protein